MKLALVGGTGPEGLGLAMRFAAVGHDVLIGSRSQERGEAGAESVRAVVYGASVRGGTNEDIVGEADIVFLAFPYEGQQAALNGLRPLLAGKLVCTVVAPLKFVKGMGAVSMTVDGNSSAEEAAVLLPEATVVSAFQNMPAQRLHAVAMPIQADVLVCGEDVEAKRVIIDLAGEILGVRGVDGGALSNSRYVEMLTSLLINLNRQHGSETCIKIVGIGD